MNEIIPEVMQGVSFPTNFSKPLARPQEFHLFLWTELFIYLIVDNAIA